MLKVISWVASLAVFPLWAEFYFFSSCYKVCCLTWNLCNFIFLDQELSLKRQCRNLRKWFKSGDLWRTYGEHSSHTENSGDCSSARLLAVIADQLRRGTTAGWCQRVLRSSPFLNTSLPTSWRGRLEGCLCKGIGITYKMYFWYMLSCLCKQGML